MLAKLASGQTPAKRFIQYQETDWFCFDAVAGGQYTLTLYDPEYSGIKMVLRNEAGDSVGAPATGKAFKIPSAGSYSISLTAREEAPYSLSLSGTGTVVDPPKQDTAKLDTGLVVLTPGASAGTYRFDAVEGLAAAFSATESVSYTLHVVPSTTILAVAFDPFTEEEIAKKTMSSGVESTLSMQADATQLYAVYLVGASGVASAKVWLTSP